MNRDELRTLMTGDVVLARWYRVRDAEEYHFFNECTAELVVNRRDDGSIWSVYLKEYPSVEFCQEQIDGVTADGFVRFAAADYFLEIGDRHCLECGEDKCGELGPVEDEPVEQYPEHVKLQAVADKSQACGEFIDWLADKGIHLASYVPYGGGELQTARRGIQDLLAEYFEIDRKKLEAEKDEMLEAQRRLNERVNG